MEKVNLNQKTVSSSKKSKKSLKQTSDPISEKYSNLLKVFDKVLTDWKKCSVSGSKIINEEILAKKKEQHCLGKSLLIKARMNFFAYRK